MLPTISIGPLVLPTTGLVYIIGAWIVLSVVERAAKALDLDAEATYSLAAVVLVAGFVGARIVFVLLHWTAFADNLIGIVWPLTSGFDLWGGLIFAVAAGFFYARSKDLPRAATLDALTPGILVVLIVVSLADFFGGPGYGTETSIPLSINVFGIRRHAVQVYEILLAVIALFVWWWSFKRRRFDGQLFLVSISVYAAGRLVIDAFRANAPLTGSGYHIIQIVSLIILLVALYFLGRGVTSAVTQEVSAVEDSE